MVTTAEFAGYHDSAVEYEPAFELRFCDGVLEQKWQGIAYAYAVGAGGNPERHKIILADRWDWRPIPQIWTEPRDR